MAIILIAVNQTALALPLEKIPVPHNEIPANGSVILTDFASVVELQNDSQLLSYIMAGSVLLNNGSRLLDHDESVTALSPTVRQFRFWESDPVQSTVSETFVEAMSRTSFVMTSGVYRFNWLFELRLTPAMAGVITSRSVARVLVEGTEVFVTSSHDDEWRTFPGWDRFEALGGESPVLSIEYRRDPNVGGSDVIEIRRLKIGIDYLG